MQEQLIQLKKYQQPTIRVVSFHVELGYYGGSLPGGEVQNNSIDFGGLMDHTNPNDHSGHVGEYIDRGSIFGY